MYLNEATSPFLLSKPAFDSNVAAMDAKKFISEFDELIIKTAYEPLKQVIFSQVFLTQHKFVCFPTITNKVSC